MDRYHAPGARISLGSLVPPDVDAGAAADPPKSCLLDSKPFFGSRTNATTASYHTTDPDDNHRAVAIQATLFVARPPRVSYVLAWATGTRFTEEPLVISTHGGFVLLTMAVRMKRWLFDEYYIYHPGGSHAAPSLELIPQPSCRRLILIDAICAVGLLSHGGGGGGGGYHVAALAMEAKGEFDLYLFSSETRAWTVKKPILSPADWAADIGDYTPDRAIAVGDGGAMAFVDVWNGILFCNYILNGCERPELHYLQLPSADLGRPGMNYRLHHRDIALDVLGGDTIRIRFIEVVCPFSCLGWFASTWNTTTTVASPWRQLGAWQKDSVLYDSELSVVDGVGIDGLLPEALELEDRPTFGHLIVDMPMLSLHENNVVCFLARHNLWGSEKWVVAIDMDTKKVQGVNLLQVGRCTTPFYSNISDHLSTTTTASGEKGDLKKRLGSQKDVT